MAAARNYEETDKWAAKAYKVFVPLLVCWLTVWIVLSWPAMQDDALIHLRYANNLLHTHHITYDGVHSSYGASSLLYVLLLAFLRNFTQSPNLARGVSTVVHLILFAGLITLFTRFIPRRASLARLLGLILLCFVASPSAVRWLDDGMETGLGLCAVTLICWLTFSATQRQTTSPVDYIALLSLGFFTVMLRTELVLLCGLSFLTLVVARLGLARSSAPAGVSPRAWAAIIVGASPILGGGLLALIVIVLRMHVLLPDTALAKSHGLAAWKEVLSSTPIILAGALLFGVGLLVFWLVSVALVLRAHRFSLRTLVANTVFPVTLFLAALRGQEIQGARYLAWTFFYSILWNIFEISIPNLDAALPRARQSQQVATSNDSLSQIVAWATLVLILLAQPVEAKLVYRVLTLRAHTLAQFESAHLDRLHGLLGTAFDVGFIGYFSQANICDLAGLVNGRPAARMTNSTRAAACAARNPGFIFANSSQVVLMRDYMSLDGWQVCGHYDFVNLTRLDTHYLLLPAATAADLCPGLSTQPSYPVSVLLASELQR
jgi:hypothetical protein